VGSSSGNGFCAESKIPAWAWLIIRIYADDNVEQVIQNAEKIMNFLKSIHHDGSARYVRATKNEPLRVGSEVALRLRASPDAGVERVFLRTCPDGEQTFLEMRPEESGPACTWWQAVLTLSMPVTSYRFLILTGDGAWWYNGLGLARHIPTDAADFRLLADTQFPDWVRDSVFYQVFPDRFADGDPASNVRDGEFSYHGQTSISRRWGDPQGQWPQAMVEFYGGDLPGVEAQLDYLADLGVNALYLNPIFSAYSNHRYDVVDYYNVDPHLGGNDALASLRRAASARGMRLLLDIVPNHCGVLHPWFQETLKNPQASRAEYFTFRNYPDDYECWLGVQGLPKLNYRSQKLREEMYAGSRAIFRYWLRPPYQIDGWRVDVANMLARHGADQLEREVWEGIRRAVKEENPQAYLLGENFFDGSRQLQGDHLDASMNYAGFTHPLWFWLDHFSYYQHSEPHQIESPQPWPTQSLVDTWAGFRAVIPWQVACQQFNLLGSHDTARILSVLKTDPGLNRLAVVLLMTYVGVPCVYYGDEIGMQAGDSLSARDCMIWDKTRWDAALRTFYQQLVRLRRESPALRQGGFQVLVVEKDLLVYQRDSDEETLLVIANRGPSSRPAGDLPIAHGGHVDGFVFDEIFTGLRRSVTGGCLSLPDLPVGAQIWRSARN
jgi:alpha-glucosidase